MSRITKYNIIYLFVFHILQTNAQIAHILKRVIDAHVGNDNDENLRKVL